MLINENISDLNQKLENYRRTLNDIDEELIIFLSNRFKLSELIAEVKSKIDQPILQSEVWKKSSEFRMKTAILNNIDVAFIEKLFELIHQESILVQEKYLKKNAQS